MLRQLNAGTVLGYADEEARVGWVDDGVGADFVPTGCVEARARTDGDLHRRTLGGPNDPEDDVLLEHCAVAKGGVAGFEDVDVPQRTVVQQRPSEWPEV